MNDQAKLTELIERDGITIRNEYKGTVDDPFGSVPRPGRQATPMRNEMRSFRSTISYPVRSPTGRMVRKSMTIPFYQGMGHTTEPTAADVLYCIVSDAQIGEQSFEDFCSDFGYDLDSRLAEKTWKACVKIGRRVRAFLPADKIEEYASAEH